MTSPSDTRREIAARNAANRILTTGEQGFAQKLILELLKDEAILAEKPKTNKHLWVCSALLRKTDEPDTYGHRAGAYYHDNEMVVLGSFISQVMKDGWALVSYDVRPGSIAEKDIAQDHGIDFGG